MYLVFLYNIIIKLLTKDKKRKFTGLKNLKITQTFK